VELTRAEKGSLRSGSRQNAAARPGQVVQSGTDCRKSLSNVTEGAMKLIVLGATGGVGLEIVRQAIEQGHSLTAFVRSPDRLKTFGDRLAVVRGNPLEGKELARVIESHDAVLSSFGPRVPVSKDDGDLLRRFAAALTSAMSHAGVRRAVLISTAFLFKNSVIPPAHLFGRLFFPGIMVDAAGMEDIVAKSGLDWTIVRPPQLTNKPRTGAYRVREGRLPVFGFNISRADTADFMISAVANPAFIGKVIGVSI
jgi:putative NADH-flavin reductase